MCAAKVIPDRLRENSSKFVFLDLNVDADWDSNSFIDLVFSMRHNYTLRYVTLVRTNSPDDKTRKPIVQRTTKELRMLIKEILQLPRLEMLDFENFEDTDFNKFGDLLRSASC